MSESTPSVKKTTVHLVPSDAWSESIELNPETQEWMIKRTFVMYKVWKDPITQEWQKKSKTAKEVEWFPLSHWGFAKSLKTTVIVFRVFEKRDITKKQELVYYALPVTYSIRDHPKAKDLYLKSGERIAVQYVGRRKTIRRKYSTINLREIRTERSHPINTLLQDELPDNYPFSYLDIKLGKGKEISKERVELLVQSGQVMRITDEDLKRRVVLAGS
jgi:hypothetical protein